MLLKIEYGTYTIYREPDMVTLHSAGTVSWEFKRKGSVMDGAVAQSKYREITLWSDTGVELESCYGDAKRGS